MHYNIISIEKKKDKKKQEVIILLFHLLWILNKSEHKHSK